MEAKQKFRFNLYFPSAGHFMGSWAPVHIAAASEENTFIRSVILLLLLPFVAEDGTIWNRVSLWSAVLAASPPNLLPIPGSWPLGLLLRHFWGCCGGGSACPCQIQCTDRCCFTLPFEKHTHTELKTIEVLGKWTLCSVIMISQFINTVIMVSHYISCLDY